MARKTEEICKISLHKYLVGQGYQNFYWEDLSQKGIDPPDFYLYLNNIKYAVEVTETRYKKKAILNNGLIMNKTYIDRHKKLVDNIEKIAKDRNIINGVYVVHFFAPVTSKYFNKIAKLFESIILEFIENTYSNTACKKEGIKIQGKMICDISKIEGQGKILTSVFTTFAWAHSPENIETIADLLQDAIDDKAQKLVKIKEPKILVVKDTYLLSDSEAYNMSFSKIRDIELYNLVFIVIDENYGYKYYGKGI